MHAIDVMTTNVITTSPDTSVQAVAMLLSERGISGVPVVDSDGRVTYYIGPKPGPSGGPRAGGRDGSIRSPRTRTLPATTSNRMAAR